MMNRTRDWMLMTLAAVVLLGACAGGYWDQTEEYGNRPMFDSNEGISRGLHDELVRCGADGQEDKLPGLLEKSNNQGFFIADTSAGDVSPSDVATGNTPGWVFGTLPVGPLGDIEVTCRKVDSVPDWLWPR